MTSSVELLKMHGPEVAIRKKQERMINCNVPSVSKLIIVSRSPYTKVLTILFGLDTHI